jgi:2-methylcitrate dehydratase PrpD
MSHDDPSGATRTLLRHARSITFDDLPADLVTLTKRCVLDTLGVIVGASGLAPEARPIVELVKEMAGNPESSLLGFGGRAPALWATFANGSLAHMLDYDGLGKGHVSAATIPAAFAVAEKIGGVSGRDLIASIAAGADLMVRLYRSIPDPQWDMKEGWFATQLFGGIAAAIVAGRLLGLNEEQMEYAAGIAYSQASGSRQMAVGEASHLHGTQAGFGGQAGVLAALLAQRGITGPKEILEGRYGLYKTYIRIQPDWEVLTGRLGTWFPVLESHEFKIWPACGATRTTNAAILQLRQEHGLHGDDVEALVIRGGDLHTEFLSSPIERKRRPETGVDGKFSLPFTAAAMMVRGHVGLRDYTTAGLNDPAVLAMAQRVRYQGPPSDGDAVPTVEIRTRDGRVLSAQADGLPGDSSHPPSQDMLETKFRDAVSFSDRPVPPGNVEGAIELLSRLDELNDATQIARLLA